MDGEDLGLPVAWQIRDVPTKVRKHYVDMAYQNEITVAQLMTRLMPSNVVANVVDAPATALNPDQVSQRMAATAALMTAMAAVKTATGRATGLRVVTAAVWSLESHFARPADAPKALPPPAPTDGEPARDAHHD